MPRHDKTVKGEDASQVKKEAFTEVIDLDLDDDEEVQPVKAEVKKEVKKELAQLVLAAKRKEKKAKQAKVKKEQPEDGKDKGKKEKHDKKEKKARGRSRSARRKKQSSGSSSSSSSEDSSSSGEPYEKFKPYSKVTLVNLVRKAELNGKNGQVVAANVAVSPCPPGCVIVRLETGREIAVKPPNLRAIKAFHAGPQRNSLTQEQRLQQVLYQIKMNVDCAVDSASRSSGNVAVLDGGQSGQGGIGHVV
eukprot:TRINITY_DN14183_c0_g1_i1.p1 TRINITY_DN14183_c0_g1~~TRINITY_DN14183_c0_g1_i1.p1  ORF type:complete len:248 (-),score=69.63 TRINITY_DN14183_c0_g1_i1:140-883(-)